MSEIIHKIKKHGVHIKNACSYRVPMMYSVAFIIGSAVLGGSILVTMAEVTQSTIVSPSVTTKNPNVIETRAREANRVSIVGRAEDHILLKFKKSTTKNKKDALFAKYNSGEIKDIAQIDRKIVKVPKGKTPEQFISDLKKNESADIDSVELDMLVAPAYTPNDSQLLNEWHINKINAPTAWDSTKGNSVVVAVADTGVECTHPDLAANCVPGWNIYSNNNDTSDVNGHGTAVAGTIAAVGDNANQVAGVSYQTKIMPIRIADANAYAYWSSMAQAIIYAADHGVKIINISYQDSTGNSTVRDAANYMRQKGGHVVFCEGNSGIASVYDNSPDIINVSATDQNDSKTSWSTFGADVDISAPGDSILTTSRDGAIGYHSGTSFSSPIVAATLALIRSVNPTLTRDQVEAILFSTADDLGTAGYDTYYGWGRVNTASAVTKAKTATGTLDIIPPSAPIVFPATTTATTVTLLWAPSTDNVGIKGYTIYRDNTFIATVTSGTRYVDSTVSPNSTYQYGIEAYDLAGNTSPRITVTAVTQSVLFSVISKAVSGITINGANVSWTTSLPATAVVRFGTSVTSLSSSVAYNIAGVTGSVSLNNLVKKTKYYYQIVATSADGKQVATSAVGTFTTKTR